MEALSREFRGELPWELLYADDLALLAKSERELMEKIRTWRVQMEKKGLRVNMEKTKVMRCQTQSVQVEASGRYPCGVCKKGVGTNSILCQVCKKWIHKRCSGVKGKLRSGTGTGFKCGRCDPKVLGVVGSMEGKKDAVLGQDSGLEFVDRFCYLGDVIGAGGGCEEASRTRVKCAWGKFRELLPILTQRGVSARLKGKIYKACVQSVMVYGSETWAVRVEDMRRLERAENMMCR